jgi:glycosyltransferase involved in cell wall biosynthesis
VRDEDHLARLRQRCRALGIADRVQLVTEPLPEAASFWREADVTVRATNTDGNSLAVLEALWLGVPVVASDCVERPAGSVLFRTRDASDLAHKLESVLSDLPTARARARAVTHPGSVQAFSDLYDALAAGVGSHAAA